MKRAVVTIPASTANLGPAFDCLALALGLHNTLELEEAEAGVAVEIEGEGAGTLPEDGANLTLQAAERVFREVGRRPGGLRMKAVNRIPLASGLGSSAAAVLGGLLAADALAGASFSRRELLRMALEFEGHADNAAASLHGGLNVVSVTQERIRVRPINVPHLIVAAAVPEIPSSTQAMRRILPEWVAFADAVHNLGHALLTVEALRRGDIDALGEAMQDRLHQPYRTPRIPGYEEAAAAARDAGAAAVVLSGAGPGIIAFARSGHAQIAEAMVRGFDAAGVPARSYVLPVDQRGCQVRTEH